MILALGLGVHAPRRLLLGRFFEPLQLGVQPGELGLGFPGTLLGYLPGFGLTADLFDRLQQPLTGLGIDDEEGLAILAGTEQEPRGLGEQPALAVRRDPPIASVGAQTVSGP